LDLQLPVQSVPFTTKIVSSNPVNGEVKKIVTGRWFSAGTPASSTNKTDRHDVTEILLKVVLRTINQTNHHQSTTK
jgi:hypothetical protein